MQPAMRIEKRMVRPGYFEWLIMVDLCFFYTNDVQPFGPNYASCFVFDPTLSSFNPDSYRIQHSTLRQLRAELSKLPRVSFLSFD
jgi:hypothetical protein